MTPPHSGERKQTRVDFVLKAAATDRDLWFKQMTGIGPMTTPNLKEAMRFPDEQSALSHPANRHMLAIFDAVKVEPA